MGRRDLVDRIGGAANDGDGSHMSTFESLAGGAGQNVLELTIDASPDEIAEVRHAVAAHLRHHGVASSIIDDVQLVTSELVTNGVLHGEQGPIAVAVDVAAEVVLVVSNVGSSDPIPAIDTWATAPPLALTGRGLGIVRRLCDEIEVRDGDGRATVICRRRLPDGPHAT